MIGDMPPNTPSEVTDHRRTNLGGESYWSGTAFRDATTSDKEVARLKDKEIPVHAFYVATAAQKAFEDIAKATGGDHGFLKIDSVDGAEALTATVAKRVLFAAGGAELVAAYDEKYAKRGYV